MAQINSEDKFSSMMLQSHPRLLEVEAANGIDIGKLTDSQKNSLVEACNFDPERGIKSVQKSGTNDDVELGDDLNTLELLASLKQIEVEVLKG